MTPQYSTPGVYIEELDAFPRSIVAVPTAIPAFIGYTQFATDENGQSLNGIPFSIQSQSDFETYFGTGYQSTFDPVTLAPDKRFYLYDSIRLFYANGGGQCYIVSIGNYTVAPGDPVGVLTTPLDITTGSLLKVEEVTLIVIPDVVSLTEDQAYKSVYPAVLAHCNFMRSRMGIFDLIPQVNDNTDPGLNKSIINFRSGVGINFLNYGTAYFPWLESGVVPTGEVDFESINLQITSANFITNFGDPSIPTVNPNITTIVGNYTGDATIVAYNNANTALTTANTTVTTKQAAVTAATAALATANAAKPPVPATIATATTALNTANTALTAAQAALPPLQIAVNNAATAASAAQRTLQLAMVAVSPKYQSLIDKISAAMNLLPPSGAIAGVYTTVDNSRGVWKAPANVSLNSVDAPSADFNRTMTDNLNVDAVSGKSINAIRSFSGIGTLVFGARTLDGNSQDWRYISVRRTLIMMEQSIKLALRAYVFEPNDDNTWITVKSMIANFLTNLWKQGALAGIKPEDAFKVMCGLGVTMTAQDILDGYMRVTVLVAVVHPAEFIELTFEQELQTS